MGFKERRLHGPVFCRRRQRTSHDILESRCGHQPNPWTDSRFLYIDKELDDRIRSLVEWIDLGIHLLIKFTNFPSNLAYFIPYLIYLGFDIGSPLLASI